ncbi:Uncharacterised protein [Shimwellia blattae]|nr:Uncharacterised protein [Shimwellia blattae]VEC21879.1 Uncharacterised protein [Shimwellia blattae]
MCRPDQVITLGFFQNAALIQRDTGSTAVELRLAKRCRELEMLFLTLIFQAEFLIR